MPPEAARPRVLLVAPQAFFTATGTPFNVLTMSQALGELGYEVHLATFPHGQDATLPGLVHHRTPALPWVRRVPVGFSLAKACYDFLLAGLVFRLLLRHRFVAVQAVEEAAFFAVPLARLFRTPAVVDLDSDICGQLADHPSGLVRPLGRLAGPLRRAALRRATAAVTVARHLTDLVRREAPGVPVFEIRDIPLPDTLRPPEPAAMARLQAELDLAGRRPVVYTGNFDRRQGLDLLLDAWAETAPRHPDAVLLLVGGELAEVAAMRARAQRLEVAESVRLPGKQPAEIMADVMGLAEVLVSPRLEPYVTPLKIYSYMASGRAIVATDLPTHNTVLDATSAILVPPTAEGLAAGITQALADPAAAAALGARAKALVENEYSYAVFRRRMAELYRHLGGRPPSVQGAGRGTGMTEPT